MLDWVEHFVAMAHYYGRGHRELEAILEHVRDGRVPRVRWTYVRFGLVVAGIEEGFPRAGRRVVLGTDPFAPLLDDTYKRCLEFQWIKSGLKHVSITLY